MEFNLDTAPVGWYLWQSDSIYGSDVFCIGTLQFIVIGVLKLLMPILVSISTSLITSTKTKTFGRGCEKTLHETMKRTQLTVGSGSTCAPRPHPWGPWNIPRINFLTTSAERLCPNLTSTPWVDKLLVNKKSRSQRNVFIWNASIGLSANKATLGITRSDSEMPAALHMNGGGRVYAAQCRTTWP